MNDETGHLRHLRLSPLFFLVLLAANPPLHAGGGGDKFPSESVSGHSHWTHTVDLEELEEGKHNLVITAVDEAGNVRVEGPYDFRVDPETDIPSVAVAHPRNGDRVGRMLPIIGTARDDDGVSRVEVSVDGGSWRRASGTEAWSAVLDAGSLGDGPHSMSVKCVDVNGIESPLVDVPFIVDTSAPAGGVADPESGAVVAGKTAFSGVFEDPNGVESLDLSRDGGESWESLRFSKDKDAGTADFSVDLDSRDMEDGPVVWWFRAVDSQGSLSEIPFLFFVDNEGPLVTLDLPVSGEDGFDPVPGNVFLAGTISDLSGVESLTVQAGKETAVDVPVRPGDPWWTVSLDLSSVKDKKADVMISAVDGAGNVSSSEYEIPLDAEADRPSLTIDGNPSSDDAPPLVFPEGEVFFTGVFSDDDGAGSVVWSAGGAGGRIEVERSWRLDLPELPVGEAEVVVFPEDVHGIAGDPVELSFLIAPPAPLISLDSAADVSAETAVPWVPGTVFTSGGGSIAGSVVSEAGRDVNVTYVSAAGEEADLALKIDPEDPSRSIFRIDVKKGSEPGPRNFILRATDAFGGESVLGSGFYMEAEPDDGGAVADPRLGDEDVNLPLPFLRESDGAAILRDGQPLQGWTSGASASGARIEPETPLVRLRTEGSSFTVEKASPGLSAPFKVVLPDGSASRDLVVLTDHDAPSWRINGPSPGAWSSGTVAVSGTLEDAGGVASASWSFAGSPPATVELADNGGGRYSFEFEADLSGRPEGPGILELSAVDASGNVSRHGIPITLDATAPRLSLAVPPPGTPIGARSTLVYEDRGEEAPLEVSLTVDGEERILAEEASLYALELNLAGYAALPETLSVRAVDRAGNAVELTPALAYDPVSDKPVTKIQTPAADSVIRGPADLAGLVMDDDAVDAVHWRIDGGEWKKLPGGFSFNEPLPLDSLADGAHYVEAYAVDAAGNEGEVDGAWFSVTRREAEVALLTPEVGSSNSGITEISGTAADANGIAEVWVSFDNGHTYSLAEGATDFDSDEAEPAEAAADGGAEAEGAAPEEPVTDGNPEAEAPGEAVPPMPLIRDEVVDWHYALDTGVLDDGVHTLLIKVVDGAGDEALLAGLLDSDNRAPLLEIGDPLEGSLQTGSMVLEGRVRDLGGIESFAATIERDGEVLMSNGESRDGVFHIPFDFSGLEAGEVLLRVEAADSAGNEAAVSRTFSIEPGRRNVEAVLTLPVEGGSEGPRFVLAGFVPEAREGDSVTLVVDDAPFCPLELDERGRFAREIEPGELSDGEHVFRTDVTTADGEGTRGASRTFSYASLGPWIVIDGYPPGMAVGSRPLITGRSGFQAGDPPPEDDKDAVKEYERALRENRPERVEVSIDGGLSFEKAKGREEWEFRIETQDMGEGDLPVLVRALYPDGWTYARTLLRLDKTLPDLKLNESVADGRFNGEVTLTGSAGDDRDLEDVSISVRPGGHGRYEVPSFVQGMYFDASVLGATWFTSGLGATFFDDNVKLGVSFGWAPELVKVDGELEKARVSGSAFGATILANLVYLPLGYYWGPKWEALSFSLAVGANFTYFSAFGDAQGGVMSSVVVQSEIPKIEFEDRTFFTYLAPYVEGRLWFFSSDVDTKPYLTFSLGLRVGLL